MDKSVARLNIEHYQKLLKTDLDETKRQTILRLLAEEEATLARLLRSAAKTGSKADGIKADGIKANASNAAAGRIDGLTGDAIRTNPAKTDD
ncbi:MAG TPA: hypothetical protein VGC77_01070 [Rhodopseudomonas sp.]|uniref:hypothetical protein n=1 Tax=Rhodopseudomonas sp. TaxID=1078 RepID=UPI002ED8B2A0